MLLALLLYIVEIIMMGKKKVKSQPEWILWIWSYSKENWEVKFGAEGSGLGVLYLKFTESLSIGVWQIKTSRTSLNIPIILRPFWFVYSVSRGYYFLKKLKLLSSSEENMYIVFFPYHSLWVLEVPFVTNSRQAFSKTARWVILGVHSDQDKQTDSKRVLLDLERNCLLLRWCRPPIPAKSFSSWFVLESNTFIPELTGLDTSGLHTT